MKKPLPEIGDKVKLRGREPVGTLKSINDRSWAKVEWEAGKEGPRFVHLQELEKLLP